MTTVSPQLAAAQARVRAARAKFGESLADAQLRLAPSRLAADGRDRLRRQVDETSRRVVDDVTRRPTLYATVAGGVLLFLLRHRVAAAIGGIAAHVRHGRRHDVTPPYPGDRPPDPTDRKDQS